ncbi:MAG: exodeoxyribonuclease VII large subunit [Gemmatimonadaceae bacterium]
MRRSYRTSTPRAAVESDLFGSSAATRAVAPVTPGSTPETAIPVASITETARAVIEGSFSPLWVRGEVSDFKRHRNGHWYFCLRDASAQVRCVVWSRSQRGIPTSPDEGMEVTAYGQLTVYAARGEMHLNVTAMDAVGDGLWRKAMEETRLRLDRDGLLAAARKRALPYAPTRVGMVTSPDGAALRDVISVIRRRAPHVSIVVSAATVQGVNAPAEIVAAIQRICRFGEIDVLIVGRGGGGREDLWAFNDEAVARAIAGATVPVISGVGHEIDITIADLVADHRAATPSAAAEAAVPLRSDLLAGLRGLGDELSSSLNELAMRARARLENGAASLKRAAEIDAERRRAAIGATAGQLNALSPLATLARGYAVARAVDDRRTLSSIRDFNAGALFTLTVRDGEILARATESA